WERTSARECRRPPGTGKRIVWVITSAITRIRFRHGGLRDIVPPRPLPRGHKGVIVGENINSINHVCANVCRWHTEQTQPCHRQIFLCQLPYGFLIHPKSHRSPVHV